VSKPHKVKLGGKIEHKDIENTIYETN